MDWISVVIVAAIVLALGLNALVIVPRGYIAVPTRFGRKTQRALGEGLQLKLPLVDRIGEEDLYPAKVQILDLPDFEVRTQRVRTTLAGFLVWKPDFTKKDPETGQIQFMEMHPVGPGLEKHLRGLILDEAGKLDGEHLVRHVKEFNDAVVNRIQELEAGFGIHIRDFRVTKVAFPKQVEDSLEDTKRAEAQRIVAEQQIRSMEQILEALRNAKAPAEELNAALVFLDRAKKDIKAVEVVVPKIDEIVRPLLPLLKFGRSP